jgi:hypothetical protein
LIISQLKLEKCSQFENETKAPCSTTHHLVFNFSSIIPPRRSNF